MRHYMHISRTILKDVESLSQLVIKLEILNRSSERLLKRRCSSGGSNLEERRNERELQLEKVEEYFEYEYYYILIF